MGADKVVIKKYANRRLYDTSGSRYINLEDIAALVRNGKDLQVVDAKTGEDLTRVTLTQIIVEDAKEQPTGLPLELLRQLIVASDRVGQEFIMWYLKSAFDAYKKVQNTLGKPSDQGAIRGHVSTANDEEVSSRARRQKRQASPVRNCKNCVSASRRWKLVKRNLSGRKSAVVPRHRRRVTCSCLPDAAPVLDNRILAAHDSQ